MQSVVFFKSFLQWMLQLLRGEKQGKLFTDEFRSPVWVEDLCRAIELVCNTGLTGLFHCGGPDRLSRWQFGELVANVYGIQIDPSLRGTRVESGLADTRPADVSMDSGKLKLIGWTSTNAHTALETISAS